MERIRYIVSYDIADPKRLRRVAKICEGFGSRLQYSVFECPLDDLRLERLKAQLGSVLREQEDQVLIISLGAENATSAAFRIEAMGLPYFQRQRITIV
ncbi:MAG: CRISPR-associated endonuclease Cas2 [Verrucomicrobiota bacterium]